MSAKKATGAAKKVAKAVAPTLSQAGKDALEAFPLLKTGGKLAHRRVIGSTEIDRLVGGLGDLRGKTVVEVAAGPGLLTRALLEYGTPRCALYTDKAGVSRLTTPPSEKHAGAVGVFADILWDIKTNLDGSDGDSAPWTVAVDGLAPPLKEDYVLLSLRPKYVGLTVSETESLRYVVQLLMRMRAKKLPVAFEALGPGGGVLVERAGLDPRATGYTLTFQDFVKIAKEFDRWEYKPANLDGMDDMFASFSEPRG